MKLRITDGATSAIAVLAISARIFFGVVVDMPNLNNSSWLAILLGAILATPLAFAAYKLRDQCKGAPLTMLTEQNNNIFLRAVAFIFAAHAALDGATMCRALSTSASYVALSRITLLLLILPLVILCFWSITFNGDSVGNSARIWLKLLPPLSLLTIVFQFNQYKITWLAPILGPGIVPLIEGAVKVAGWLSMLVALFLITDRDDRGFYKPYNPMMTLWSIALLTIFTIIRQRLMAPVLYSNNNSRVFQLDILFSNGRTALSTQLPMLIVYFVALLHILIYDGFICAAMLQHAIPKLSNFYACLIASLTIGGLSFLTIATRDVSLHIASWLFVAYSAVLIVIMIMHLSKKGGEQNA